MGSANVKGGFWGELSTTYTPIRNKSPLLRRIAQWFNRAELKGFRELALTLNGAAAGSAASETHAQIKAGEVSGSFQSELGGVRTIETVTDVSANTTSDDETAIDSEVLAFPNKPSSYPANGDGNPRGVAGG